MAIMYASRKTPKGKRGYTTPDVNKLKRYKIDRVGFVGVYFLFFEGELVYIGKSKNIHKRVNQHKLEGVKEFDSFSYSTCSPRCLEELELKMIRTHNPKYNIVGNDKHGKVKEVKKPITRRSQVSGKAV